ncbi:MAG TPA: cobalt ECF transporter T component CbiQ [Candidatus Limnocylindria bacterium]|nr:cobalt ECF transporter T component CbiQ [Candidatus Limnocylindria bacterium]
MHAADARLKFVLTVAAIVAVALVPRGAFAALGIGLLGLTVASASANLGPFRLARGAVIALPFLLATVPLVFLGEGPVLATWNLGPLSLTVWEEGLRSFATIAAKSWLSVQAALLLTYTTPFHELVDALRKLRLPEVMVAIIGFMVRYLDVLADEAGRLMRARASRSAAATGRRPGGTLGWRARVTGGLVGSLFLRSYERSERIYAAMQARGFSGTFRHFHGRTVTSTEWVVAAALAMLLVAFAAAANFWLPRL